MRLCTFIFVIYLIPLLCFGQQNNLVASKDSAWFEPGDLFNAYQEKVIKVHPSLPNYRITFRVDELDDKKFGRTSSYTLKVFVNDKKKPLQVFSDTLRGANFFIGNSYGDGNEFPDINFDGYSDLPITLKSYALGDRSYDFYLFDKNSKKFKRSQFTNLTSPLIYPNKKMISTTAISACQGHRCGETKYYKVVNDTLKLIRWESTDLKQVDTTYYRISTHKKLVNGKMEVIKADTSKIED